MEYTISQKNRLTELGLPKEALQQVFDTPEACEQQFKKTEKKAISVNRNAIRSLVETEHQPKLILLQRELERCLCKNGFTQVVTPTIISRTFLERMTIDGTHPLNDQVFWLDRKSCLRPMLAPNLYDISRKMMKITGSPLRVFEVGSCFRKESEGNEHLKEFTMLNLVEWGTPMEERTERLKELGKLVMEAAGLGGRYEFVEEESVVYGKGMDIVGENGLELASTSMGPHKLDEAWKVISSWVGIGTGLERLLMYRENEQGIHRHSRSISFLNGARLNIL